LTFESDSLFQGFRVVRELGRGGMGVVLLVEDPRSGRLVVLKTLREDRCSEQLQERFRREAVSLGKIEHRSVVRVFRADMHSSPPFIEMEFIQGSSLADRVMKTRRQGEKLEPDHVVHIAEQLVAGLSACHAVGIVHRDLKPENVVLEEPSGRVVIVDFGIVKLDPSSAGKSLEELTQSGALVGTPGFMAPEQMFSEEFGEITAATDVWGLGATLFQALGGEDPYGATTIMELAALVAAQNPRRLRTLDRDIPKWLDELCADCLQRDARARPSLAELSQRLRQRGQKADARKHQRIGLAAALSLCLFAALLIALGVPLAPEKKVAARQTKVWALTVRARASALKQELDKRSAKINTHFAEHLAKAALLDLVARPNPLCKEMAPIAVCARELALILEKPPEGLTAEYESRLRSALKLSALAARTQLALAPDSSKGSPLESDKEELLASWLRGLRRVEAVDWSPIEPIASADPGQASLLRLSLALAAIRRADLKLAQRHAEGLDQGAMFPSLTQRLLRRIDLERVFACLYRASASEGEARNSVTHYLNNWAEVGRDLFERRLRTAFAVGPTAKSKDAILARRFGILFHLSWERSFRLPPMRASLRMTLIAKARKEEWLYQALAHHRILQKERPATPPPLGFGPAMDSFMFSTVVLRSGRIPAVRALIEWTLYAAREGVWLQGFMTGVDRGETAAAELSLKTRDLIIPWRGGGPYQLLWRVRSYLSLFPEQLGVKRSALPKALKYIAKRLDFMARDESIPESFRSIALLRLAWVELRLFQLRSARSGGQGAGSKLIKGPYRGLDLPENRERFFELMKRALKHFPPEPDVIWLDLGRLEGERGLGSLEKGLDWIRERFRRTKDFTLGAGRPPGMFLTASNIHLGRQRLSMLLGMKAELLFGAGDHEKALSAAREAAVQSQGAPWDKGRLCTFYTSLDRFTEAEEILRSLERLENSPLTRRLRESLSEKQKGSD